MNIPPQTQATEALLTLLANPIHQHLLAHLSAQGATQWTGEAKPLSTQPNPSALQRSIALTLSGALAGELLLALDPATAAEFAAALPGAAGQTSEADPQQASPADTPPDTLPDPPQALLALLTEALKTWQPDIPGSAPLQLSMPRFADPSATWSPAATLTLCPAPDRPVRLFLGGDAALLAGLQPATAPHAAPESAPALKLDRVVDVPLAVTLRFGERHMTLREVLALTTGTLVELDRQVEEPVELMLGSRLIARGEVVIVDGNYGLRVTEVVEAKAQRMQQFQAAAAAGARYAR